MEYQKLEPFKKRLLKKGFICKHKEKLQNNEWRCVLSCGAEEYVLHIKSYKNEWYYIILSHKYN